MIASSQWKCTSDRPEYQGQSGSKWLLSAIVTKQKGPKGDSHPPLPPIVELPAPDPFAAVADPFVETPPAAVVPDAPFAAGTLPFGLAPFAPYVPLAMVLLLLLFVMPLLPLLLLLLVWLSPPLYEPLAKLVPAAAACGLVFSLFSSIAGVLV